MQAASSDVVCPSVKLPRNAEKQKVGTSKNCFGKENLSETECWKE